MNPDTDIQALIDSGDVDGACEMLWGRYRLTCIQFLLAKFPGAGDDQIASAVADGFLQLRTALLAEEAGVEWPLRNRLFLLSTRRIIDSVRKQNAKRRGGDVEWLFLDADSTGEIGDDAFGKLIDDIMVNEVRERLILVRDHLTSSHQRGILSVICDSLPDRVYLGDLPEMLRARGIEPPRPNTLKRSLQEVRRKLAADPVLQSLRTQPQN